ncbi:MAG: glycosyltransferase [Patescibacteria group bacterium]
MKKLLIVIPAYNEAKIIKANLEKLADYAQANLQAYDYKIVVSDNNSTDLTGRIVKDLLPSINHLEYLFVPQKGKGVAVLTAWQKYQNDYDFFAFMDADLATDLRAFLPLVTALEQGYDLAIGSRYLKESEVRRSLFRKIMSYAYRLFIKIFLNTEINDFPTGFKAVSQKVVKQIIPLVKNTTWFFDSEIIYQSEKRGLKIKEIPVKWVEPRGKGDKSRVNPLKVSLLYLKEIIKLRFFKGR